jgi:hypothetical protein
VRLRPHGKVTIVATLTPSNVHVALTHVIGTPVTPAQVQTALTQATAPASGNFALFVQRGSINAHGKSLRAVCKPLIRVLAPTLTLAEKDAPVWDAAVALVEQANRAYGIGNTAPAPAPTPAPQAAAPAAAPVKAQSATAMLNAAIKQANTLGMSVTFDPATGTYTFAPANKG